MRSRPAASPRGAAAPLPLVRARACALACVATLAAGGCSNTLEKALGESAAAKRSEYKSSRATPVLEVPPDLSNATIDPQTGIPELDAGGSMTYSAYENAAASVDQRREQAVLPELQNVGMERSGDKRWLVVKASPGQVWPLVREFWFQNGFTLKFEDPTIGIMETDWAENTLDVPRGFIRDWLGRLLPQLNSASTRDKFRVRLERGVERGTTEIYVSHRGAETRSQKSREGEFEGWRPRGSDPELEAEMLTRLMIYFGVNEQRAERMLATSRDQRERAHMIRDGNGATALSLEEEFSRAWRRTGLALDRVGFTVEDRDRSRGLYYVRYMDPDRVSDDDDGLLSKLKFWESGSDEEHENAYLISLVAAESNTQVVVLDKEGQRDTSTTADRILTLLHEQLR